MAYMPEATSGTAISSGGVDSDFLYFFGGALNSGNCVRNIHKYIISTNTWDSFSDVMGAERYRVRAVLVDGEVWLIGGYL